MGGEGSGGKRKGAGRPSTGRVVLYLKVAPETRSYFELEAARQDVSMGEVADEIVDALRHGSARPRSPKGETQS